MELWQLKAYAEIRDLISAYNSFGDRGRFDQLLELFAETAVMDINDGRIYEGADQIKTVFTDSSDSLSKDDSPSYIQHHTSSTHIEFEGDKKANSKSYFSVFLSNGIDHWGRYEDKFENINGKWLFVYRRVKTDGYLPEGWAAKRLGEKN
tara:strand:+ start:2336 stop:2785 length:450 start_codon:yes stop_codon:yes gene_type:complete